MNWVTLVAPHSTTSQSSSPIIIPIFSVSCVTGTGLAPLHAFLAHLQMPASPTSPTAAHAKAAHADTAAEHRLQSEQESDRDFAEHSRRAFPAEHSLMDPQMRQAPTAANGDASPSSMPASKIPTAGLHDGHAREAQRLEPAQRFANGTSLGVALSSSPNADGLTDGDASPEVIFQVTSRNLAPDCMHVAMHVLPSRKPALVRCEHSCRLSLAVPPLSACICIVHLWHYMMTTDDLNQ